MFGYSLNYLIDMENAIIVDVEATPTRISKEVEATEITPALLMEAGFITSLPVIAKKLSGCSARRSKIWR
jgi:hypothetical protein